MENTDDILKMVTGSLKGKPKNDLLSGLDTDQPSKEEFRKIKNAWALASTSKKMTEYRLENLYLDFKKRLDRKQKLFLFRIPSSIKYAAVFVLAVGISSLFFSILSQQAHNLDVSSQYTTVIADNGQISKIILPDSSVVWLNSGTQIQYKNDFAVNNREITLTGQAFFQVTKNRKMPLKVFSNDLEVKVLGTKFDVSAYPDDKQISVFLETGEVEILSSKSGSFRLSPGEMVEYNKLSGKISQKKVNPEKFTAWKDGVLVFRDDPMDEVIPKLQRRFDIEIEAATPDIHKSVFTATIKNETLEDIFKSISFACSVNYKIIKGENLHAKTKIILTNYNK
jgi:transmembrane sensor